MPGKFVVKKGSTGKFRFSLFSLLSTNGRVVSTSEAYNTKAACMNGVKAVRTLAADASLEDQTTKQWAAEQQAAKKARPARSPSKKATTG